jgi:hypothetical protein
MNAESLGPDLHRDDGRLESVPHFRHPGERRDPGFQPVCMRKAWAPTYVGVTRTGCGFVGATEDWRASPTFSHAQGRDPIDWKLP